RSFCSMDTVLSIRNVACPQTRPRATSRVASIYRAEAVNRKFQQMRQQRLRRPGISPEATFGDEAFRARPLAGPPLRSQELAARPGGDAGGTDLGRECQLRRHVPSMASSQFPEEAPYLMC